MTAAVAEIRPLDLELLSPELVLVSPPELGDRARLALPDYEREFEEWIARTRAAFEAAQAIEQAEQQQLRRGAVVFTAVMALNSIAALLVVALAAT